MYKDNKYYMLIQRSYLNENKINPISTYSFLFLINFIIFSSCLKQI